MWALLSDGRMEPLTRYTLATGNLRESMSVSIRSLQPSNEKYSYLQTWLLHISPGHAR